jgi:archaellum component FlaG (FlaF/FlaG flagellin family)
MSVKSKRLLFIATFLIVAAVAIVLCVTYLAGGSVDDFEGTLVQNRAYGGSVINLTQQICAYGPKFAGY